MSSGEVAIGCDGGLFTGTANQSPKELQRKSTVSGTPLWVKTWGGYLAVATSQRVYLRNPDDKWWWEWSSAGEHRDCSHSDHDYAGGAVEFIATVGAFDPAYAGGGGGLWLGSEFGLQVWDLRSGELRRFGRDEGLPTSNVTVLLPVVAGRAPCGQDGAAKDCCCVWVGTTKGAVRKSGTGGDGKGGDGKGKGGLGSQQWTYLRGRRWLLAGDEVTALVALGGGTMLVATNAAVNLLTGHTFTLEKKAMHYQNVVMAAGGRHSRYGYASACGLRVPVVGPNTQNSIDKSSAICLLLFQV